MEQPLSGLDIDGTQFCVFCLKSFKEGLEPNEVKRQPAWDQESQQRFYSTVSNHLNVNLEDGQSLFESSFCCPPCLGVIQDYCELYKELKCLEGKLNCQIEALWNVMRTADRTSSSVKTFRDWCGRRTRTTPLIEGRGQGHWVRIERGDSENATFRFRNKLKMECQRHYWKTTPRGPVYTSSVASPGIGGHSETSNGGTNDIDDECGSGEADRMTDENEPEAATDYRGELPEIYPEIMDVNYVVFKEEVEDDLSDVSNGYVDPLFFEDSANEELTETLNTSSSIQDEEQSQLPYQNEVEESGQQMPNVVSFPSPSPALKKESKNPPFVSIIVTRRQKAIANGETPMPVKYTAQVSPKSKPLISPRKTRSKSSKAVSAPSKRKLHNPPASTAILTASVPSSTKRRSHKYKCLKCEREFTTSNNLQRHLSQIHGKVRECPHCKKVYTSTPAFRTHLKSHNKEFECTECGKLFSREWILQEHMMTHTGEKPFQCEICEKSFVKKCNLLDHVRIHTGEKPFKCRLCGKVFAAKTNIRIHIKNMHPLYGSKASEIVIKMGT